MKWFKHMTNSSLDERLARFTDKYGLEAYGFFWRVLEAIAENVDETNRKHIEYSTKTWCKLLGIRPQTFRKLIQESSVLGLFQVSFNSDLVSVESPNILKYRDEWTRKKSKAPEQNSEKEKEKETEKEEERPPVSPDGGEGAGEDYPVGKKQRQPKPRFTVPTEDEVSEYCRERNNGISGQAFCDFYASRGWCIGKQPMRDWKAAVRTWENKRREELASRTQTSGPDDMEAAMERVRQRNERLKAAERGEVA